MPASKAQLKANKKYKCKHRKRTLYQSYKSTTKNFILHEATSNDINKQIPEWIKIKNDLKKDKTNNNEHI